MMANVKSTINFEKKLGEDEAKIKIAGKRSGGIAPTLENAETLLNTMRLLRGGRGICPRGVYRFKTFEEADEWMLKMIAQSSLASRR
jgi:hypothetical protein